METMSQSEIYDESGEELSDVGSGSMLTGSFGLFLTGALCGAAAAFLFDERSGARRRALVRDKLIRWNRLMLMAYDKRTRDLGNRIYGTFIELRQSFVSRENEIDDTILVERIRSKVGRVLSHPRMLHVECIGGRVTISGVALSREMNRLYDCVRHVRGVRSISVNNVRTVRDEREMSYSASRQASATQMPVELS